MSNPIVQYILIRSDLKKVLNWSTGALIAQACHATSAVMHLNYEDPHMKEYLQDLDNMHKIVLQVPDEAGLRQMAEKLSAENIAHKLWIEQPENIPTCLVLKPYPKDHVSNLLKQLKLYRD